MMVKEVMVEWGKLYEANDGRRYRTADAAEAYEQTRVVHQRLVDLVAKLPEFRFDTDARGQPVVSLADMPDFLFYYRRLIQDILAEEE
jgi:hypothetical protein